MEIRLDDFTIQPYGKHVITSETITFDGHTHLCLKGKLVLVLSFLFKNALYLRIQQNMSKKHDKIIVDFPFHLQLSITTNVAIH